MTINPAPATLLFLFRSLGRPRHNRPVKSFHSRHKGKYPSTILCDAVRMLGLISHIDKCFPLEWTTASQISYTYSPAPAQICFPPFLPSPTTSGCNFHAHGLLIPHSSCHLTLRPLVALLPMMNRRLLYVAVCPRCLNFDLT
jgi:hypothetical protein